MKPSLWSDKTRTLVITTLVSALPVLQLLGVINLTGDGVAVVSLFISNAVTTAFFIMRPEHVETPASL